MSSHGALSSRAMSTHIFTSAPHLHAILRCDMEAGEVRVFASDLSVPRGLVVTADGTLWAVDVQSGRLYAFDKNGKKKDHATLASPSGLAIGPDGNFYVSDDRGIVIVESNGTSRVFAEVGYQEFLAFDGKLSFYCAKLRKVKRVDLQGQATDFHVLNDSATGLACDHDGNVYTSGERKEQPGQSVAVDYIAQFEPSGAGRVHLEGFRCSQMRVLGYSPAGYLIYSTTPATVAVQKSPGDEYIRSGAFPEYAATAHDFNFP
jgi:sugar lactone lactonase YvrE